MIYRFAEWLVVDLFGLSMDSRLGQSVHFFIYDTTKIILLLATMVFVISYIRSFFPPERTKRFLTGKNEYVGNTLAALLGVVSPFCSCSTVPIFIGFLEAGVPLGVTFSFLISSPIVNEVSLVMLFGLFGWKIALLYMFSGVVIAIFAGIFIGKLKLENQVEEYVYHIQSIPEEAATIEMITWKERARDSWDNVKDILSRVWIYVMIGIGIGAVIHGYAPEDLLVRYAGKDNFFAAPIATLIGVPLYSNAVGSIPVIEALLEKGVAIGTALSFMMAMTALSLPEVILLRKVIKPKLIGYFLGIVSLSIVGIGYLFNAIL
ncbi:permease [Tepidibacillus sp. HK-1]|uniref:permease n=1 Tax=Tepidibacillus sp. HK-1 TaxID=1883407 RepID=UPI00085293F5|nr:permease [Tepidibacillus sp. HK-1]GBF10486.1 putative permease [Tepidibacillus sp. HK-1]